MVPDDRNDPLRILMVSMSPVLSHEAPGIQVANMAQAFADLGHRVTVVTPTDDPSVASLTQEELLGFRPDFTVSPLSRRVHRGQSYTHALRIARRVRSERIGFVYSRSLRACLIPAARGVPTVLEVHTLSSFDARQDRWALQRLLRSPGLRGIVAISAGLADDLVDALAVPEERILVAHDAVRLAGPNTAEASGTRSTDQRRTASLDRTLVVGYTGSLFSGRGVDVLLAAVRRAPWLRLHLVGGPAPVATQLRAELAAEGLAERVTVHGVVTPVRARALQREFDVLVAPFATKVLTDSGVDSTRWMSPMKIFEYMASGRPMVTSDLPVLREVLRPGVDALMVRPEDPDALLEALGQLRDDPEFGELLARSALTRVASEFTWERRARQILERFIPPSSRPPVSIVVANLGAGGAERVLLTLAGGLAERGVAVRLLVLDVTGPLESQVHPDVTVVDLGGRRVRSALPPLLRALRAEPPRAIISSQTHVNLLLTLVRPLFPRRSRLIVREPQLRIPDGRWAIRRERLLGRVLGRADVVVASSAVMASQFVHVRGRMGGPAVIPNPVDVDALRGAVAESRRSRNDEERSLRLVALGRLIEEKGYDDLIAALADPRLATCTLTLIGGGPLMPRLAQQVTTLGLGGRVTLLGPVDDRARIANLVAHADLLVHPAHLEGMPNTVLEALALGTPVLSMADLPMLAELAADAVPGSIRLVDRGSLAAAIADTNSSVEPIPRPCLLPDHFRVDAVTTRFLDLIGPEDA